MHWKRSAGNSYQTKLEGLVAQVVKRQDDWSWSVGRPTDFPRHDFEGISRDLEAAKGEARKALLNAMGAAEAKAVADRRKPEGDGNAEPSITPRLRGAAEMELAFSRRHRIPLRSVEELIHELEVHQIELEMQNETLRQTEIALEESRNRFRDLYEFAPVGYLTLSHSGRIIEINLTGAMMLGEEGGRLRHRPFVPFVMPEDQDEWQRQFRRAMIHGERKGACELRLLRRDDTVIDVSANYLLIAAGKATVLRVALTDITARKQAETALRLSNDHLDGLVEERTRQWKEACEKAERAKEAKSHFLAAASHDLRQPLQALSLYLGALGDRLSLADAPIMNHIDICLRSLSSLLGELLDLSKLDAKVVRPKITDFPLAEMVNNLVAAHGPAAEAKGIRLRFVSTRLWAHCDPILFERAVGNLVANAVRYTESGGIVIGCRRRGGRIWVEVVDTGIGIPDQKHEMIFEEFRQLGNQERNREKGAGLGLAIVRKTAELLGLDIRVGSQVGHGSCFALSVPLATAAGSQVSTAAAVVSLPLRIVLVEDDANVRDSLAFALSSIGHEVIVAPSADVLSARLGAKVPDFILTDYRLGGDVTGLDVVTEVRAKFGETIPAAVLTGDTDPEVVRRIDAFGATVLHKPVHLDALKAALAQPRAG